MEEKKKAKERVIVFICANMSGAEKRKLMAIGKSKHDRCFPTEISSLPVIYTQSSNAWMTERIFEDYMEAWNKTQGCQERKVLLLDNFSVQHSDIAFSNIEIPPSKHYIVNSINGHGSD